MSFTSQKSEKKAIKAPSKKKTIFYVITAILPLVFFLLLEISLRLFNYGPNLSLFNKEVINGTEYYSMNPEVGKRYFYQVEFSPYTTPDLFAVNKSKDTYRIFCLGASTTVGYPYWYNASFSSFLRQRLQTMFPDKKLEIVNLGLTATNSFTVNDMAEELPEYQPDLLIVYDGHNEFYGALGGASRETFGSSRLIAKLYLKLIHRKTFLLFRDVVSKIASWLVPAQKTQERGTTMERLARGKYIPITSDTYRNTLTTFSENLIELKELCNKNKIPLMLSSQVSNVRNQPPFISGEFLNKEFRRDYEHGLTLLNDNATDSAKSIFRRLLLLDSTRADVHFQLAQCFDREKNISSARNEYESARDYDQLRFRASSDLNSIIQKSCNNSSPYFVDMVNEFRANALDSIIGNELIFEHLHPTSRGYFLMAKKYAEIMEQYLLFATQTEWRNAKEINENELWNERPVSELDERLAQRKVEILTAAWPFTQSTVPIVSDVSQDDTLGNIIERLVQGRLDWLSAHQAAAEFYVRRSDKLHAAKEYELILATVPYEIQPYHKAAKLYLEIGNLEKVKSLLTASLSIKKTILAFRALGDVALKEQRYADAVSYYEGMNIFDQNVKERLENGYLLSLALFKAEKPERSKALLLSLLQLKPDFTPATELLFELQKKK